MTEFVEFDELIGKTLSEIRVADNGRALLFYVAEGELYQLSHSQDCCENVRLEEIVGDLVDLVGEPITQAEVVSSPNGEPVPEYAESWTWTFYKMATIKGSVTLRWLGESNGYYSESVDFVRLR